MKNTTHDYNQYILKTYLINQDLSFSIAYEKTITKFPANGGLRFYQYLSKKNQEIEALVLAKHMSEKHKLYNTNFSGVKIVANGEVNNFNKLKLLKAVGQVLNQFNGKIFTGCDLNINNEDISFLSSICPYILNALHTNINTSISTAYGVWGSLTAVMTYFKKSQRSKQRVLINGVGKVGGMLTRRLLNEGYQVYTYDIHAANANILGAINISHEKDWHKIQCDYLILCSTSNIINQVNVNELNCQWILSSANSPFADVSIMKTLTLRDIRWIPDVVSNAGAVICDAIEYWQPAQYKKLLPTHLYEFVYTKIYHKTMQLLELIYKHAMTPIEALYALLSLPNAADLPIKIRENCHA